MNATRLLQRVLRRACALATSLSRAMLMGASMGVLGVLIGAFLAAGAQAKTITLDGDISDWSDVAVTATDPAGDFVDSGCGLHDITQRDIRGIKITADAQNLYYLVEYGAFCPDLLLPATLAFNIDSNISTGCQGFAGSGIDLVLNLGPPSAMDPQTANLYSYSAACTATFREATPSIWNTSDPLTTYIEGAIPLAYFPNSTFQLQSAIDNLTAPATVTLTPSANPPNFSLSPTTLNFGTIQTNATSTAQTVALTSTGGPLTISSLVMSGANPGDFLITGNTCTTVVNAGGGCSFGVAFSPIAANTRSASLQVLSNAPTQAVVLQGVGGPLSASSTKVDTRCIKSFWSEHFDNHTICDVIRTLRDRFQVTRADASNDELYAWLENDANKSAALALIENEKLGDMVQRYLAGAPWDSKIYRSQVSAIYNGSTTLISLITKLKTLLDVLGRENPVVTFVGRIGPIIEIVQTAVDAYIEVNKVLQAGNAKFLLADYITERCGTESRVHCTGNDAETLTSAQRVVTVDNLPLVQQLLCKAFSPATCNPIPEADITRYLNSLELSYQAFRLVGYSEDSPLIRQELGKKLVSVIKTPAQ